MKSKRARIIKTVRDYFSIIEKNCSSSKLIPLDERLISSTALTPTYSNFMAYLNLYERTVLESDLSDDEIKELNEIKDTIKSDYKYLNFGKTGKSKTIHYFLAYRYMRIIGRRPDDKSDFELLDAMIKELFGDSYNEFVNVEFCHTALISFAFIFANLLIKRKELTEEQYLLLAPHLYPSLYHPKVLQVLPIIKFKSFENDYEWAKDNAINIALALSAEGDIDIDYLEEIFGISLDGDDDEDNGDSSANSIKI